MFWAVAFVCLYSSVDYAQGQAVEFANRPISELQITGLQRVPEQLVRNNIRTREGDAYDPQIIAADVARLTHLDRFSSIKVDVQQKADRSLIVTFVLSEFPLLIDVQVNGNDELSDQRLLGAALLRNGDPASPALIKGAINRMLQEYREEGYHFCTIDYNEQLLDRTSLLVFNVREGPLVKIKAIRFEGNDAIEATRLQRQVSSETALWPVRDGILNLDQLDNDAAAIRNYYNDHGYLDARVRRRIEDSPDQTEAIVTFLIEEGRQYTLSAIRVEGNTVFSTPQIVEVLPIKIGDVFSRQAVREAVAEVTAIYHKIGYVRVVITTEEIYEGDAPRVQMVVRIEEGNQYLHGTIRILNNTQTKDKVVLRQVRGLEPGRPFDGTGIERTRRQMSRSQIFGDPQITLIDNEANPDILDVLIEVQEKNTGSLSFGVGVNSDLGIGGAIQLTQRNFDIADYPATFTELFTGKAFTGAGQFFDLEIAPGTDFSRYRVAFAEPAFLETDYSFNTSGYFLQFDREKHDEDRIGFTLGTGRRFGDVWSVSASLRFENYQIKSVSPDAPVDVANVEGSNVLAAIELGVSRSTVEGGLFPHTGSVFTASIEKVGLFVGDFDYWRVNAGYTKYWTIDRDFMNRRSVLEFRTTAGYILPEDEAPTFERYYAGGHSTFRGFDYRGVGPRGIRNDTGTLGDDPVGGDFLLLVGLEYSFPLYDEYVRGVVFLDTGTVDDQLSLSKYRVSTGFGFRVVIPLVSRVPFAIDFGIPLIKESGDETQLVSFTFDLPFQ